MGTLASEFRSLQPAGAVPPRVYADANVPAWAIAVMRHQLGWDVLAVVERDDLRRARDREHYVRALELERVLITFDRDFLDDQSFPEALSPGVIVLSAVEDGVLRRLLAYLDHQIVRLDGVTQSLRGRKVWVTSDVLGQA